MASQLNQRVLACLIRFSLGRVSGLGSQEQLNKRKPRFDSIEPGLFLSVASFAFRGLTELQVPPIMNLSCEVVFVGL
jgi:hypothetical protein